MWPRCHDEAHQRSHAHRRQALVRAPHKAKQQLQDALQQGCGSKGVGGLGRWVRALEQ